MALFAFGGQSREVIFPPWLNGHSPTWRVDLQVLYGEEVVRSI